ncbi:carboxylesterase [uncultured Vibrio sp.]|uniref:alpha/beta hydrolase n=1 Tax=uncultured Vibrio sp. TaxID=114054 RepID=UPI0025E87974|nr:alpha/beta hydrolase [uncultured Vibrio sp.]
MNIKYLFVLLVALVSVIGCAGRSSSSIPLHQSERYYNYIQPSFGQYVEATQEWLEVNRAYISDQHQKELAMNMPYEQGPAQTDKAILLVHGLGDSPYSFSDIANSLERSGFHVQVLLLPGHGSNPEHMHLPKYEDWQLIVDHYANLLKKQYQEVWLGGFSTGGNLATIHALDNDGISGLMLFSPGFETVTPFLENFTPLVAMFWEGWSAKEDNFAKYNSAPLSGAIEYSRSASVFREKVSRKIVTIPTLMVVSESDSVIDAFKVKEYFNERFVHPANRLIWYATEPSEIDSDLISAYSMQREDLKISTGSHMSPLFAPANPYYGEFGEKTICDNSFSSSDISACEQGHPVWFSAWGYSEGDKIFARLTWNPYFSELEKAMGKITQ